MIASGHWCFKQKGPEGSGGCSLSSFQRCQNNISESCWTDDLSYQIFVRPPVLASRAYSPARLSEIDSSGTPFTGDNHTSYATSPHSALGSPFPTFLRPSTAAADRHPRLWRQDWWGVKSGRPAAWAAAFANTWQRNKQRRLQPLLCTLSAVSACISRGVPPGHLVSKAAVRDQGWTLRRMSAWKAAVMRNKLLARPAGRSLAAGASRSTF